MHKTLLETCLAIVLLGSLACPVACHSHDEGTVSYGQSGVVVAARSVK